MGSHVKSVFVIITLILMQLAIVIVALANVCNASIILPVISVSPVLSFTMEMQAMAHVYVSHCIVKQTKLLQIQFFKYHPIILSHLILCSYSSLMVLLFLYTTNDEITHLFLLLSVACNCNRPGGAFNRRCNMTTGQCDCRPDIAGRTCDTCIMEGFYGPVNRECKRCKCVQENTIECNRVS